MQSKEYYIDLYKTAYDKTLGYARERKFVEARESLLASIKALECLVEMTFGEERAGYHKKSLIFAHLVKDIERKINSSGEEAKKPEPERCDANALIELVRSSVRNSDIKASLEHLIYFLRSAKEREKFSSDRFNFPVYAFFGGVGTGKSFVAKIIAKIYYSFGYLKTDEVFEYSRGDLAAGYIGESAKKTAECIEKANGGVLFIDDFSELYSDGRFDRDFACKEIISVLAHEIMNPDRTVIILSDAGDGLEQFIRSNPSVECRISAEARCHFPDFTKSEMLTLFDEYAKQYTYILSDEARSKIDDEFSGVCAEGAARVGNARYVRNFFERTVQNQAVRLAKLCKEGKTPTKEELCMLLPEDVVKSEKRIF